MGEARCSAESTRSLPRLAEADPRADAPWLRRQARGQASSIPGLRAPVQEGAQVARLQVIRGEFRPSKCRSTRAMMFGGAE